MKKNLYAFFLIAGLFVFPATTCEDYSIYSIENHSDDAIYVFNRLTTSKNFIDKDIEKHREGYIPAHAIGHFIYDEKDKQIPIFIYNEKTFREYSDEEIERSNIVDLFLSLSPKDLANRNFIVKYNGERWNNE